MPRIVQYPALSAPPRQPAGGAVPPIESFVDALPDIRFNRRALPVAVMMAACVMPQQTGNWQEAVHADAWARVTERPTPKVRPLPAAEHKSVLPQLITWAENIHPDAWVRETERVLNRVRPQPVANHSPGVFPQLIIWTERTTPDKWQPPSNQPYFLQKNFTRTRDYSVFYNIAALGIENVTVDKWFRETERPRSPSRRLPTSEIDIQVLPANTVYGETITLDKWYRITEQPRLPLREIPRFDHTAYFNPTPIGVETITVDKWFRELERPQQPRRSRPQIEPIPYYNQSSETITLDKWAGYQPDQMFRARDYRRLYDFIGFIRDTGIAPETVTLDKYYRETERPQQPRRSRPQFDPTPYFNQSPETVSIDRFDSFTPDFLFRRIMPRVALEQAPVLVYLPTELLTLDKWVRPTEQPMRTPKRLLQTPHLAHPTMLIIPEGPITVDKWFRATEQPVRFPRRRMVIPAEWRMDIVLIPATPPYAEAIGRMIVEYDIDRLIREFNIDRDIIEWDINRIIKAQKG